MQNSCEEKEKKLRKELVKGPKDVGLVQEKLKLASDSVHLAEAEGLCYYVFRRGGTDVLCVLAFSHWPSERD